MEFAIKWMYSVDSELEMPYQDNLQSLMNAEEYRQIVGPDLWKRMDYIRRCGNSVAHSNRKLGRDEAMLCLENLLFILIILHIAILINMKSMHLIKLLLTQELRKQKNRERLLMQQEKISKRTGKGCTTGTGFTETNCRKRFVERRIVRSETGTTADICSKAIRLI